MALLLAQTMAQDWCPKMFADLDCTDSGTPPTLCLPHRVPTNLAQVLLWSARSCSHPLICKAPPAPRPAGALSLSLLPCPALLGESHFICPSSGSVQWLRQAHSCPGTCPFLCLESSSPRSPQAHSSSLSALVPPGIILRKACPLK